MAAIDAFLAKWSGSEGSEAGNSQHFLIDLCDLVGLKRPGTKLTDDLRFEKDVPVQREGGLGRGRVDLFRRGAFVLESKQFTKKERDTNAWKLGMQEALGQALGYASGLDDPPPFLIACDVGYCFELRACFDGSRIWRPFPDAQSNRVFLDDLRDPQKLDRIRLALTNPMELDPSRHQVEITRDIADKIAHLVPELRKAGHSEKAVASFLIRCLFTMFAEDVGLFEDKKKVFEDYLRRFWIKNPASFPGGVSVLWQTMDTGGPLMDGGHVHRFNGGLFKDHSTLPLTKEQLEILLTAAERDWSHVEPAIFGTLLENALHAKDRHALGAHFTPRAYVERLVRPTIEEPLRAEWGDAEAAARIHMLAGDTKKALQVLKDFHARLCKIRVLDPACGTGNFLYVAMDLMKRLEEEVLARMREVGGPRTDRLELDEFTVSPRQFLGIEKNPWAKEIAELVLWIGYLRLQWRLRGSTAIAKSGESILRDEKNIECRDAVLDWDGAPDEKPKLDDRGRPITRWDGETTKKDPLTGLELPDDRAKNILYEYAHARVAAWPEADFIVGNPPFVGNKRMRTALGDGYVDALRDAHPDVSDSADFVMYWWDEAARRAVSGRVRRFGLITTNSINMSLNRRVVERHLAAGLRLAFAVPDHPWVDSDSGAAVRIAMTCGTREPGESRLAVVAEERPGDGVVDVVLAEQTGTINASLSVGATATTAVELQANSAIAFRGAILGGEAFLVTDDERPILDPTIAEVLPLFVSGRDLTQHPRGLRVIDLWEQTAEQVRARYPIAYQRLLTGVRPGRRAQTNEWRREHWWLFSDPARSMRPALRGLKRFVITPRTAKFRTFFFAEAGTIPESEVVAIASDDAFTLGACSARPHTVWSLEGGGRLGIGNDPRYTKTVTFDPFPFPAASDAQKMRIRDLAERLDAHRKRQLAAHPKLTITGMYNVLEKLRADEALSAKDKAVHEEGLVSILRQLHDELDAAVFDAYGWDPALTDEQLLEKLVALNTERAAEEKRGLVRWLRPDFQTAKTTKVRPARVPKTEVQPTLAGMEPEAVPDSAPPPPPAAPTHAWPADYFARASVIREIIATMPDESKFDAAEIAAHIKGKAKSRVADVATILETLAALGKLVTLAPGQFGRATRRAA